MSAFWMIIAVIVLTMYGLYRMIKYIPNSARIPISGYPISLRLVLCKLLPPLDAGVTLVLMGGAFGLAGASMGFQAAILGLFTGFAITVGIQILKKWFIPQWKSEIEEEKRNFYAMKEAKKASKTRTKYAL